MYKYVLAASVIAVVEAQDCTQLTDAQGSCGLGSGKILADLTTLTNCKDHICNNLIGMYAIVHGSDMTKKLAGSSYGCQIEDWDGGSDVGEVICMPAVAPGPGPGPEPGPTPGPGPNPSPGPSSSSSSSGIDGGAVFLIIFFVGFAVYFAAGMAYQYKVKGATGVEMVPNLEFWKDLPNLMKDGFFFLKNKATGGGYSSV